MMKEKLTYVVSTRMDIRCVVDLLKMLDEKGTKAKTLADMGRIIFSSVRDTMVPPEMRVYSSEEALLYLEENRYTIQQALSGTGRNGEMPERKQTGLMQEIRKESRELGSTIAGKGIMQREKDVDDLSGALAIDALGDILSSPSVKNRAKEFLAMMPSAPTCEGKE